MHCQVLKKYNYSHILKHLNCSLALSWPGPSGAMRRIIFITGGLLLAVTLGIRESSEKQDQTFVENYREFDRVRTIREAKTNDKKVKKKVVKERRSNQNKNRKKTSNKKKPKTKRNKKKQTQKTKTKRNKKGNGDNKKRNKWTNVEKEIRQETCTGEPVTDDCLVNAVAAMDFEKNQMKNFQKQKIQLERHNGTSGKKYTKKGDFEETAGMMLTALGGNFSAPVCGEGGSDSNSKSAKSAMENYNTLKGCNEKIKIDCTMEKRILNETMMAKFETCLNSFKEITAAIEKCRTDPANTSNGAAACACWSQVAADITAVKKEKCQAKSTANAVKTVKNRCIESFGSCKRAQDDAIGLIHTCMKGEVQSITSDGRRAF